MINQEETEEYSLQFDVSFEQIHKDHAISHILIALGKIIEENNMDNMMFFGGTALNRTVLKDFRLSEDVDLIISNFKTASAQIKTRLAEMLENEFPQNAWINEEINDDKWTGTLQIKSGISIQIEIVEPRQQWNLYLDKKVIEEVQLRYSDVNVQLKLPVPSTDVFVAMKLNAWFDRHTPRDLADLYMLAQMNYFTKESFELARKVSGVKVTQGTYANELYKNVINSWEVELSHQGGAVPSAQICFEVLQETLNKIVS